MRRVVPVVDHPHPRKGGGDEEGGPPPAEEGEHAPAQEGERQEAELKPPEGRGFRRFPQAHPTPCCLFRKVREGEGLHVLLKRVLLRAADCGRSLARVTYAAGPHPRRALFRTW